MRSPLVGPTLRSALLIPAVPMMAWLFVACGDDDVAETPKPTPTPAPCVDPDFVDGYPHTWAMVRQAYIDVYVADTIVSQGGWYPQIIWSYYLVNWADQTDGTIQQTENLCFMETSNIVVPMAFGAERVQNTVIPQQLVDSVEPATWTASINVVEQTAENREECPVAYQLHDSAFGPQYWVFGAELNDPINDTCPLQPGYENGERDDDNDGNPGVTTEQWVDGEINAHLYVCSRTLYRFDEGVVSKIEGQGYRIQGSMVDVLIDQSLFGSDDPSIEGNDPESRWEVNPDTYYALVQLPDGATCDDVTVDLF